MAGLHRRPHGTSRTHHGPAGAVDFRRKGGADDKIKAMEAAGIPRLSIACASWQDIASKSSRNRASYMRIDDIAFRITEWTAFEAVRHPGKSRAMAMLGAHSHFLEFRRITPSWFRVGGYSPGYGKATHWCEIGTYSVLS